ncbi:DUF6491 family protein [Rhodanobacter sp. BL-MT-08]
MKSLSLVAAAVLAGLLAACSSVPYAKRNSDRLAAYTAAAGAPVKSFRFFTPLYSWEPLSDTQLVVYTKPKEAYLLDLEACVNLQVTNGIGLTSNLGQVQVRFDRVITRSPRIPCVISQIRPIDMAHLKAVQQAQRKIEADPRPATSGA